ncbi:MAG: DUF5916 domain-containing protein [Bacteroidota bacterium]|nr:DUF5916 domain-containing protein [Bacteroidota bacterium]
MKKSVIVFIIFLFLSNHLIAQHSKPDILKAHFSNNKIKLDGELNEVCWSEALPITNFTQREQNEGAPASEKTQIAVVYNKNEIYFGIWCFDSDAKKISAQKMARDFHWGSDDNIEIMISTFNDNRNGYLFVTNPNGAKADVLVGKEGNDFNKDWNGVWDVAVQRNKHGWFAEILIPFSTLKFNNKSSQIWGINFERNIRRKKEQILWQGWSRLYDVEKISQGGKLTGIDNIEQGTKIEVKPYLLGGAEFYNDKTDETGKIGGEINFDITPTLKLNFSVNTDFAQVESDRKQINLSRFSLYYPEKRQFFLEGKNYYSMNIGHNYLFYSRRIGIEQNTEVPIIGGTRLFGKLNKTNIGVMSIQTNEEDSIPTTNYSIIKIKQDILKQSSIGVIATQKYSKNHYNRVYGANFDYSTSNLFKEKNLLVGASFALSETKNLGESENLNKNNLSYNLYLSYPNDQIEYDLSFSTVQAGFNPEMGFLRRNNYQMLATELQFNPRFKKLNFFRNLIFKPIDINYYINEATKNLESIFYEWRPFGFVTKSGEFIEFNVQHVFDEPLEDFELINEVYIPADNYWDNRFEIQFSTFRGRKISAYGAINIGEFYTGNRKKYAIYTSFNFNKHLNINLDWERNYVNLPQKTFTTNEIGGRIDYAFNPKLQTSVFTQWNNEDNNMLVNYRINWIPKIGSYFYFVINQEYNTNNNIKLIRTTIIGKLIWRFVL